MEPAIDEDEDELVQPTTHTCPECGELLGFVEDAALLQIVQHYQSNVGRMLLPVVDDNGEFLYEPYFLHFECWESIQETLQEHVEDMRPLRDRESDEACLICASGIRQWEVSGSLTFGEFHISRRSPNGHTGETFAHSADPMLLCSYCLATINENITEFWENGIYNGQNECIECLHLRCWRNGPNTCGCKCHTCA